MEDAPVPGRSRRVTVAGIALALLVVMLGGWGAWRAADARPDIAYEGPAETVAPGATVTIRAQGVECGPLFTSLHRRGRFGLWSQTHSGNVFDGFTPDARPWWRLGGGTTFTPVPCSIGGTSTFSLPDDVGPGTIAACDQDDRCAEIRIG